MIHSSPRRGFTLIEILIAIAVLVTVSVVGFFAFTSYKGGQNIRLTMNELVAVIRDVQKRSITEQDGKQWGLHFINSTGTIHSYEVFSGVDYASGTVNSLYPLKRGVAFGNPGDGLNMDAIFSAISGKLGETRIISLVSQRRDNLVGDVTMLSQGKVTTRLETGVVGYWHFDEGVATSSYDSSGNRNNGVLINGPTWQTSSNCRSGSCLSFDGTNDYVDVGTGTSLSITQNITMETWVKLNTYTSGGTNTDRASIVQKTGQYYMTVNSANGTLDVFFQGITGAHTSSNSTIPLNEWAHVAITYDGSNIKWYINGSLDKTLPAAGTIGTDLRSVRVGGEPGFGRFTNGHIDEVRIYNRALSAEEIQNHYNDLK